MIQLPLRKMKSLLNSFHGPVVSMVRDWSLSISYAIPIPFVVCVVSRGADYYHLHLIDTIACRAVGNPYHVLMDTLYEFNNRPYHMAFDRGHKLIYTYKKETTQPMESILPVVLMEDFLQTYLDDIERGEGTPYQLWVVYFLGALELLSELDIPNSSKLQHEDSPSYVYQGELEVLRDALTHSIKDLILKHPHPLPTT